MTDVLFRFDVEAAPAKVLEAITTTEGIKGFWTSRADVPDEVGATLKLEFAVAPLPFDLRLEQSDEHTVVWRTETFPPHWVGTTVRWDLESRNGGSTVSFRHAGFDDEEEAGRVSYTWGQIMVRLKEYAETGRADPVFT
ncbi:MAG TPA: SRPBCC domain-containing protein [Gaiellaceae bacterium]|nr:SRPBCC domain-containing protein [Gaiellaceae bacterium]